LSLNCMEALFAEWAELGVYGWAGVGDQVLRLIVQAREGLRVEKAVVSAVVDPGVVRHTHDVRRLVARHWEPGEREEAPGNSVWRKLMGLGAFEPNYALRLFLAVWHRVRVVTDVDLRVVSKTLVAWSLIGYASTTLEESGLASLSNWVDAVLVEASRGGDGGVVVDPLPAVDGPVVVAVVVHSPVTVKHKPVLTNLLVQGAVGALVELVAVLLVGVQLEAVGFWA